MILHYCYIHHLIYFFYDFNNSPEFILLRKNKRKFILDKTFIICIINILYKSIIYMLIILLFNKIKDVNLCALIKSFLNIILISNISLSFIICSSNNKIVLYLLLLIIFIVNVILLINNILVQLIINAIILFINYKDYNSQSIYDKFIV